MKVAIISEFVSPCDVGLEDSYARAFRSLGHDVLQLSATTKVSTLPRGLNQLDELQNVLRHQPTLQRQVQEGAPDLVFIVKGRGVLAETVRGWRRSGLRVINLFPDSPFEAAGVGIVGRTFLAQFRQLDRIFVHDRFAVGQLRQMGIRADFIAFARDPWMHPTSALDASEPAANPIVFVGNPDQERIRYLRAVADLGLSLYGNWTWARLDASDPLAACIKGGPQHGPDMTRAISSARLSINILRHSQKTAHNMRTFETPACGVCCLSEGSVGVEELMDPGHEVAIFRSPEELRRMAIQLLASPATVDSIARAGHAHVEHETYAQRVSEILAAL